MNFVRNLLVKIFSVAREGIVCGVALNYKNNNGNH